MKLLKLILLIVLIIIDQTMTQCGIRWRGTCTRKLVKKADNLRDFIEKGKGHQTSLIRYVPGLLLYQQDQQDQQDQNMIAERVFLEDDDNYKNFKTSNAKRLW